MDVIGGKSETFVSASASSSSSSGVCTNRDVKRREGENVLFLKELGTFSPVAFGFRAVDESENTRALPIFHVTRKYEKQKRVQPA